MRGLLTVASALLLAVFVSCGTSEVPQQPMAGPHSSGLSALPADGVQPWEELDANGLVVPSSSRSTSAFSSSSLFTPGVERFLEGGDVADNAEAATFLANSYGIYRFTLADKQPSAIAVDANLTLVDGKLSQYWIGISDYGKGHWEWRGPFSEAQITLALEQGDYTSPLGNLFVAVYIPAASALDLVGIAVHAHDVADKTAPPVPAAPQITPVNGGLELTWPQVIADDLAGYRLYWSYSPFTNTSDNGVNVLPYLEGQNLTVLPVDLNRTVWVALSAVDLNGNESGYELPLPARRLPGQRAQALVPEPSQPSPIAGVGEPVSISVTGADSYDFDVDGDGTFDITGDTTGTAQVDTSRAGIIRPRVRGTSADGSAVALGSISLIVTGNQRPVANAQCTPQMGHAPLSVTMNGTGTDFDGTIAEYAWDFDGDGIYDHNSPLDGLTAETYASPGLYNAKLRVTDDQGAWDVDTLAVQVLGNELHIEALPDYAAPGQPIELMVHANAPVTKYEWDLDGDGTFERDSGAVDETLVSYDSPGPQTPKVRATFANGAQSITFVCVLVSGFAQTHNLSPNEEPSAEISLALINGMPAVAFSNISTDEKLLFVRATDREGRNWGAPVIVDSTDGTGAWPSLAEVAGVPAIAFGNDLTGAVHYVKANDASGVDWGAPQQIDATNSTAEPSLKVVNGRPAISYLRTGDLAYIRAADAEGNAWPPAVKIVDAQDSAGHHSSLAVINGNPAISYWEYTNEKLLYVRASDPEGETWGLPYLLGDASNGNTALIECDGRPAIAFNMDGFTPGGDLYGRFMFLRANDAYGGNWPSYPVHLDGSYGEGAGFDTALAVINGVPAVTYRGQGVLGFYFKRALNPQGTAWAERQQISLTASTLGGRTALIDIDGRPAVSYVVMEPYLNTQLEFALGY